MSRTKTAMLIVGACVTALSTYASASIVVQFTSITADNKGLCPGGTNGYRWSYSATISAGENDGFFTIYDFPGMPCTVEPGFGSASTQLRGVTAGLSPPDDPALWNVTLGTYQQTWEQIVPSSPISSSQRRILSPRSYTRGRM